MVHAVEASNICHTILHNQYKGPIQVCKKVNKNDEEQLNLQKRGEGN